ncbi:hypothetical protein B0H13DRAFT_2281025 [Mycena leptocephala]|nr:hypothetical protein B0H13DRAFT_2281025 [Mycena leptocephala]
MVPVPRKYRSLSRTKTEVQGTKPRTSIPASPQRSRDRRRPHERVTIRSSHPEDQILMQPPPAHPSSTPAGSHPISTASIDRILMQPPPAGHAMFSNTSPKKLDRNSRYYSIADLTRHPPTFTTFHGNILGNYLAGWSTIRFGNLQSWLTSPYGRGYTDAVMFDTDTPYPEIRPVRQALSAFAVQSCSDFLEHESSAAVKSSGGLWAAIGQGKKDEKSVEWQDLRTAIQEATQPKPRSRKGILTVRNSRPRENVTSCLAALDFVRTTRLGCCHWRGSYLSSNVPIDIISHGCRLANMPSVNTIKVALKDFSDEKAVVIRTGGRDISVTNHPHGRVTTKAKVLIFDNVQHFHEQRDFRIGRENSMIIGIAGTFFEFEVDLAALDPLDKRFRMTNSRRPYITVDDLLGTIDQPHLKDVGIIQFIEALTNYISQAAIYKKDLYWKNEASITKLKDALIDFLEQIGHVEGNYDPRLWFGGGDGMSYNNMLLLKNFLQNHEDLFQSFELLHPVLKVWHTMWTDLCRINETHWGAPLDDNPATLGHSAKKMGCAPPPT